MNSAIADFDRMVASFEDSARTASDYPEKLIAFAYGLAKQGGKPQALKLVRKALALKGTDEGPFAQQCRMILASLVPGYSTPMMND